MKTELVQIVFFTFALVTAAAVQEMAPAFGGAKPPLLLLVALCEALRTKPTAPSGETRRLKRHSMRWPLVAFAAGAFADALDGLPFGCMATFVVFACAVSRLARVAMNSLPPALAGLIVGALMAPCQEAWLNLWLPSGSTPAIVRFFASVPAAASAGAAFFAAAPRIARSIGLDGTPYLGKGGKIG